MMPMTNGNEFTRGLDGACGLGVTVFIECPDHASMCVTSEEIIQDGGQYSHANQE